MPNPLSRPLIMILIKNKYEKQKSNNLILNHNRERKFVSQWMTEGSSSSKIVPNLVINRIGFRYNHPLRVMDNFCKICLSNPSGLVRGQGNKLLASSYWASLNNWLRIYKLNFIFSFQTMKLLKSNTGKFCEKQEWKTLKGSKAVIMSQMVIVIRRYLYQL